MISSKTETTGNSWMFGGARLIPVVLLLVSCAAVRRTPVTSSPMLLDVLGGIAIGTDRESEEALEAQARLRAEFEEARRDYEAGQYELAGAGFFSAALDALGAPGTYTRTALADSRSAAYRNAARSWAMAGSLAARRARLQNAATEDAPCQQAIVQILESLSPGQ
jgi:hypothetical protein